jgi:hypothetical protein
LALIRLPTSAPRTLRGHGISPSDTEGKKV